MLLETGEEAAELLLYSSRQLDEPVAWYGPIVMNTQEELQQAFDDLENGTFIKEAADYSDR
ncbi:pirin-like C-terminal cupin domain-containing protein [Eubacterium pyruvativorans]|uniref:pirin-like C-terminal cupin domain-containing protein n=1 Tax=Eubacterium pyruvativorans TaxID=155865 RepID=UPI0030B8AD44